MILSIILSAIIIKLLDDYLDNDNSFLTPIINKMGKGILPYSLIFFSFSCLLNAQITISLVVCAYVIGMLNDIHRKLSFKLKGYEEALVVLIFSILFLGFLEIITSLLIILLVQLIDDIIDIKKDRFYNNNNLAIKFGKVEIITTSMILILILIKLDFKKAFVCLLVFSLFQYIESRLNVEEEKWI